MQQSNITSVGIDIGTSTTQLVFARLTLTNKAAFIAVPHIVFSGKDLLYQSSVYFTPLLGEDMLDGAALQRLVEEEYSKAGFKPTDIDAGAVIVTGEAARKENAAIVSDYLSGFAGEFVVVTAGPELEAELAGKGSGAQQASKKRSISVVNLDIGGGTTNLALFVDGETKSKGSLDIGGRMIRVENNAISYLSASAIKIAQASGFSLAVGMAVDAALLRAFCSSVASLIEQAVGITPATPLLQKVVTPGSSMYLPILPLDAICFSGGVADCLAPAQSDPFRYGDIGPLLGESITHSKLYSAFEHLHPLETIRATVVGAGSYSTTVSGSTITQQAGVLPMKNLPVLKLSAGEQRKCYEGDSNTLMSRVAWFLEQHDCSQLVVAMDGEPNPSYAALQKLAGCLYKAMDSQLPTGAPLLLALESDTGKALGQSLQALAKERRTVICIDQVRIEPGDYLDLGLPLMGGMIVPVVVKTLALGSR